MTREDEEFNRIEREAKLRMEAVSAALDKKAQNARELGLDYEPAQYSDIVSDGGLDPRNKFDQPAKQEPVAYLCENAVGHKYFRWKKPSSAYKPIALYTSPPAQRTWVGLTDKEIDKAWRSVDYTVPWEQHRIDVARAIEAKLREKNT